MKKFVNPLPNGGIPVFADDILMLQEELYKSSIVFLNSFGVYPLVLSGVEVTYQNGVIKGISAGEVLFKYKQSVGGQEVERIEIFSFPEITGLTEQDAWIVMDSDINSDRNLKATNISDPVTIIKERRATVIFDNDTSIPDDQKIALQPYSWKYAKHIVSRNSKKIGEITMFGGLLAENGVDYFDSTGKGRFAYEGFALCNGQNGTRDLRGRFIVGMTNTDTTTVRDGYNNTEKNNSEYRNLTSGETRSGGKKEVSLSLDQMPKHDHLGRTGGPKKFDNSDDISFNHSHDYTDSFYSENTGGGSHPGSNKGYDWDNNPFGFQMNRTTYEVNNNTVVQNMNRHTHFITPQGLGQAHENRPPYYVLAFIQRIS